MTKMHQDFQQCGQQATAMMSDLRAQVRAGVALMVSHDPRTRRELAEALGVSTQDISLLVSSNFERVSLKKTLHVAMQLGLEPELKFEGLVSSSASDDAEAADMLETLRVGLGDLLAQKLESSGMSKTEFAQQIGMGGAAVSRVISGERHMKVTPERALEMLLWFGPVPAPQANLRLPMNVLMARLAG
jgi:plasmid maintenance system antidote protein VapI